MSNRNEVFEYLIGQLRQQVNNNQCEDLAHEVQSLKSELARYKKPYIVYVKKTDWVQGDSRFLKKRSKHRADILRECIQEQDAEIQSLKNQLRDMSEVVDELMGTITLMNGDVEAYKVLRKGAQSGCRKEDTQECEHDWVRDIDEEYFECRRCGATKAEECEHAWYFYDKGASMMCKKCGLKK